MLPITVEEIAAHMSLDRRYLSRIFKQSTGKSLKEYLVEVRMREATRLLTLGYTVGRVAQLCGYPDQFNFSKMFKHTYGISPKGWCELRDGNAVDCIEKG